MTILVTAASGHLGRLAIDALLARGVEPGDIRAGARAPSALADLAERGVEVVHADYDQPASLASAFAGAEKLLLISGSEVGQRARQHQNAIDAAVAADVQQVVYTSVSRATTSDLVLAPEHKATEEALTASGLPTTILRNNWYNDNHLGLIDQVRASGELVASVGEGRIASASRADFAEAAAVVLTTDGHIGQVYELSGDVAWTYHDLAAALSTAAGREVVYRSLDTDEHAAALTEAGLDAGTIGFVTALDAGIRDGALAEVTGDLSRLIGRPTTPLAQTLGA
jgi:NAD(P)H dehydrogenase (quinone)